MYLIIMNSRCAIICGFLELFLKFYLDKKYLSSLLENFADMIDTIQQGWKFLITQQSKRWNILLLQGVAKSYKQVNYESQMLLN